MYESICACVRNAMGGTKVLAEARRQLTVYVTGADNKRELAAR